MLETGYFRPASHKGNRMAAKGFLVKHSEGDQIHLTLLQVLAGNVYAIAGSAYDILWLRNFYDVNGETSSIREGRKS